MLLSGKITRIGVCFCILLGTLLVSTACGDQSATLTSTTSIEQTATSTAAQKKIQSAEEVSSAAQIYLDADQAAIPAALRQRRSGTYAVTMEPAGTWYVEKKPQSFVSFQAIEADIALALGQSDGLRAVFNYKSLQRLQQLFYQQLPGVNIEKSTTIPLHFAKSVDQEVFLQLNPDCFLVDPRLTMVFWGWNAGQIATVARRTGPFMGNFVRFGRDPRWGPAYKQYTLDEYHERIGTLFQEPQHYQQVHDLHQKTLDAIKQRLPSVSHRPQICLLNSGSRPAQGKFYVVDMWGRDRDSSKKDLQTRGGSWIQQYHELGLQQSPGIDAFNMGQFGSCDYETLLKIDPPVIIVLWAYISCDSQADFEKRFVEPMRENPLGRRLQAVRNNRIFPGGTAEQGPITALFQLEMAAQQLFPETFGAWRWGSVPQTPLFDRAELAKIILDQ